METRKSVSGTSTFLCGAPIIQRGTMQKIVALLVTEIELIEVTTTAQDMMYMKRLLESINLTVELPMILEVDNKVAVDLINNYSVGGQNTSHRNKAVLSEGVQRTRDYVCEVECRYRK